MLNTQLDRTPLTRSARLLSVIGLLALAAAIASAQGAASTFSGAVLDPMNRTLPDVTIALTNVQTNAKHEVRSDATGRFEFADLPQGNYALEVTYPGFMALRGQVAIAGHAVQQTFNLEVGRLQETVTVLAGPSGEERQPARDEPRERAARGNDCAPTPHGGNIRPPLKLLHVKPTYPPHLASAGTVGTVLMEGVIAKDGAIKDVRVVGPAHPDFNAAAVDAVRQWQFDSTLLNCMPIEVVMNVTVNFRTQ